MSTQGKKINGVWHIRRSAYFRKAYTKSDGTRVKASRVPSTWIIDRGKPGKGPDYIGKLKKGTLTKYGYHLKESATTRHAALDKAVKKYGKLTVFRKVNALAVLQKNTNPKYASVARSDKSYLRKKFNI